MKTINTVITTMCFIAGLYIGDTARNKYTTRRK
jgi:hypothetical protein